MKDPYKHKPAQINSIDDLIVFFGGIPAHLWCVGDVENDKGQSCAMGHLGRAYSGDPGDFSTLRHIPNASHMFSWQLIRANNGNDSCDRPLHHNGEKDPLVDGARIKNRVLEFLRNVEMNKI